MARIIWTNRSLEDLEALLEFIARDSPAAARRFAQRLVAKVELLNSAPLLGSQVPENESGTYREILEGSYRLIYRVEGDVVYLVTLYHAARNLGSQDLS